jgi:hypothetical protein
MTALNYADRLYIGSAQASAAFVGSTRVWPASFRPVDIAGCVVWIDASKSYWDNLGSGTPTTIIGSPAPVFRTNALNGLPVLRITKGQGRIRFTGLNVDKNWTIIYVGRKWQLGTGRVVAGLWSGTGTTNILIGYHGDEYECAYLEGWINTPGGQNPAGTDWKMYSSDSTANGFGRLFSDGVYLGQVLPTSTNGWSGNLNISGWTNDADPAQAISQQADCEIAELVMFNRKLSDAERQQIEGYLRTKWNPITAYKPNDVSGCVIWLDASQLALADGAAVTAWPNLGSGPQPTIFGSPPPVIRANALNGKPVVKTTGAQGTFRFAGTGVDRDYTLAFVARKWTTKAGRVVAANYSATTSNCLFGWWSTRIDCAHVEGWYTPDDVLISNLDWRWYTADATSTAPGRLLKNGAVLRSSAATPAGGLKGTLCLSGHDDTKSESADIEVAELVLFNRKLSDPERSALEQYLRLKWDPPSKLFTPKDLGPNLLGWFDARDAGTVIQAGAGVSQWVSKLSGISLTQATDAYRPVWVDGTMIVGNPQNFTVAGSPVAYDIAMAGKPRPAAGNDWRTLLRSSAGNTTDSHQVIIENGSARLGVYHGGFFPAGTLTWDNVYGLMYGRISAAAPALLSRNGNALTSTGSTITSPAFVSFGAYQGPPPSQGFGDINEIVFTTYNLESVRQMLEGYLAHKWGHTGLLPVDHPYKTTPP